GIMANHASLTAVSVQVDSTAVEPRKTVIDDLVVARAIHGDELAYVGGHRDVIALDDVVCRLGVEIDRDRVDAPPDLRVDEPYVRDTGRDVERNRPERVHRKSLEHDVRRRVGSRPLG